MTALSKTGGWSQDRRWRKLLHFEKNSSGVVESQIDDPQFFFSPRGAVDAEAELQATIKVMLDPATPSEESQIPQCRFPARWTWLKNKIQKSPGGENWSFKDPSCARFQNFFKALRGPGISLVFSSYYLNNPASTFGHTFLRINKEAAADGKRHELLDYGLSYAANMDTENPVLYAFRGLFGMFAGSYSSVPYYYKVREYNNAESRDLWEYDLNVSAETVDRLLEHAWELGPTRINYWYLSENCSYHILTLLEAADEDIDLTSKLKRFVIPADTVQVIWREPGFVRNVFYRASVRTEFHTRVRELSKDEVFELHHLIERRQISESFPSLPPLSQAKVLDAGIDWVDTQYPVEVQKTDSEATVFKNFILSLRSKIDLISSKLTVPLPEEEKPHEAHGSSRWGFGFLAADKTSSKWVSDFRWALHDRLDPPQGYPKYAEISIFDFRLSKEMHQDTFDLERFNLFSVSSQLPGDSFSKSWSWRFRIHSERVRNENCDFCRWTGLGGGLGRTWALGTRMDLYVAVETVVAFTGAFQNQSGLGPAIESRYVWNQNWISLLRFWQRWDFQGFERNHFERSLSLQWSPRREVGFRAEFKDYGFDKVGGLEGFYYY